MKQIDIVLKAEETYRNKKVNMEYKAETSFGNDTSFSQVLDFLDEAKKIWKHAMRLSKKGIYIKLEVTEFTYKKDSEGSLISTNFDRWYFEGYNEDTEGIYLSADTRYTKAERDMYLSKNVLRDLAFTLK